MTALGRQSAWILLTVLALVAAIGFEQGLMHGLAAVRADAAAQPANPDREPVPRAEPLSAPAMDEATVRRIAKEEADAAVARARPKKAAPKPDADDDADPALIPTPAPLAIPAPGAPAAAAPTG